MADPFIGEIRLFAGNYAPEDWLQCNGQSLNIQSYQILFSLIGTTYGGDGVSTFALPNLNGRVAVGPGQGAGMQTNYPFASSGGAENVALTTDMVPTHGHPFNVSNETATTQTPGTGVTFGNVASTLSFYIDTAQPTTGVLDFSQQAVSLSPQDVSQSGQKAPHANMMPSLALTYIICCANGLYPRFS